MHAPTPIVSAEAVLVLAALETSMMLHHISMAQCYAMGRRALLFPVHMFPPLQMKEHPIRVWQRLHCLGRWSQRPRMLFVSALMAPPQICLLSTMLWTMWHSKHRTLESPQPPR